MTVVATWVSECYEPTYLPKELLAVWRKHKQKADEYEMDHEYAGGQKYYNLWQKHAHVCEVLERAGAYQQVKAELTAIKDRIADLPNRPDDFGSCADVLQAVQKLQNDVLSGEL